MGLPLLGRGRRDRSGNGDVDLRTSEDGIVRIGFPDDESGHVVRLLVALLHAEQRTPRRPCGDHRRTKSDAGWTAVVAVLATGRGCDGRGPCRIQGGRAASDREGDHAAAAWWRAPRACCEMSGNRFR